MVIGPCPRFVSVEHVGRRGSEPRTIKQTEKPRHESALSIALASGPEPSKTSAIFAKVLFMVDWRERRPELLLIYRPVPGRRPRQATMKSRVCQGGASKNFFDLPREKNFWGALIYPNLDAPLFF